MEDVVQAALGDLGEDSMLLGLAESPATPGAIVVSPTQARAGAWNDERAPVARVARVADRDIVLRFGEGKRTLRPPQHAAWVIPIAIVCTTLLGAYLFEGARRAAAIERRVRERTAELSSEIAFRAEAERALSRVRDALEVRVAERTAELGRSNVSLQEEAAVRQRAEQEAARANEAKTLFLASMSHEIRTPLNAILGFAQILQRSADLPVTSQAAVQQIASSGEHLQTIINDILDLSRIEAGQAVLHPAPFGLSELLDDVVNLFRQPCADKGLELRLDDSRLDRARARIRVGDAGKLRQILANLVGNAVKFTRHGFVQLTARDVSQDRCVFEVIDTGVGISEGALERVLLPFHQDVAGRNAGGTGLGLAIAHRYARLMGASLSIESKLGVGSVVALSVRLPEAPTAVAPLPRGDALPRLPAAPMLALVVDDVEPNRRVLATILAQLGCRVETASGGRESLERLAHVFDSVGLRRGVVFLDVRMPDMDGVEVLRQVREGPFAAVTVVAHSASALAHEQEEFLRSGFDHFLAKPVTFEAVRSCIAHISPRMAESAPAPAALGPITVEPFPLADLPAALRTRIAGAARIHNATALRACMTDVEQLGPTHSAWLEMLRRALRSYDMKPLLTVLATDAS